LQVREAEYPDACRIIVNGPAIKVGCGTWRSHPATDPGTLAEIKSRWQDRYGGLFADWVQVLLRKVGSRYKISWWPKLNQGTEYL
jgi:hypothetical protein